MLEERAQLVGRAQVLAEHRQINFDWHCSLPSHNVAKVRCCLARSVDAPASSMLRSRSPTGSSPFVIGHWRSSRRRRRTVLLWRERLLQFTGKLLIPKRQLPITKCAHKAGNGRRPLPAATATARSARPPRRGNGSKTARRSCCRSPTITSSSPCRRRSAPSRSTTRPPSTTSCSGPPPRR